ncbi:hypothetical protein BD779DRAFT_1668091 [Infundibulicybe gibba]|nr:hypothetical protein BD779DRAFT_1668091 [Infundibulicybe gibba]
MPFKFSLPTNIMASDSSHGPSTVTQPSLTRRKTTLASHPEDGTLIRPLNRPRTLTDIFLTPPTPVKAPTIWRSIRAVITASWLNVLLVFIPVSWALNFALDDSQHNKDTLVFVFSFLAIIPLAKLLSFATEELSLRVGQTLAGLLNATLGNAVELIVAVDYCPDKCQLHIVQSSLVGSILSNLLLVMGMCFFAGGVKFSEQGFGVAATQMNTSVLTISVIAVLLPAAFHFSVASGEADPSEAHDILAVSHGVCLLPSLSSGWTQFLEALQDDATDIPATVRYIPKREANGNGVDPETRTEPIEEETVQMNFWTTMGLLWSLWCKEFVGIILLPIVGNAAEHVTAVTVAVKDKLTLSIGVAVGSSIQIAIFVIPFIVILGWILGKPLSLLFDPYESITLFLAVLTINYVVQDGKSNWLEGMILMCLYVILGVTFWFYPASSDPAGLLASCPMASTT